MTRKSIEAASIVFIIALSLTFIWTVAKVFEQLGWM